MNEFAMLRSERRSFFCHNQLWGELLKKTDDCISVSLYVRQAIIEKMIREEPEKENYFRSLIG